jgi:hypothetical protein
MSGVSETAQWHEFDWVQEASASMVCAVGDSSTIIPMITAVRDAEDALDLEGKLLCLNKRHSMNRDPYLTFIVKAVAGRSVNEENRWKLADTIEKITGRRFLPPSGCAGCRSNDALDDTENKHLE